MTDTGYLHRFPGLRASDPDQIKAWLGPLFAVSEFDMPPGKRELNAVLNHRPSDHVSVTYARYGAALSARLQQNDYFVQGFPISGSGEVRWNRHSVIVSDRSGGIVGGPGSEATFSYDDDFSHFIVKFSRTALTQKLSALIGRPIDPPLKIEGSAASNPDVQAAQLRLVRFLADELDRVDGPLPPAALVELEQAIIVTFLFAHSHNYSHWLNTTPSSIAPRQVRTAAEYIEQNWDQPITIEALSHITQTSARSLFHLFRRTYGVSPMVFVRQVRLRHARQMLSNPTQETTVTSVGFLCGFSNMGNFARIYFNAFGEHPSDTLKFHR